MKQLSLAATDFVKKPKQTYSYREIAEHVGLHLATVGRIIRGRMQQGEN